ncbi:hypothetical protein FWF64_04065, partial [Candidatus Saccharibacteria bacterium]|nr:hypothetical protein [Candidatus Saccharibacteria bacterium]
MVKIKNIAASVSLVGILMFAGIVNITNPDTGAVAGEYDVVWSKCFGGNNTTLLHSVAVAPDGDYIVAGTTYSADRKVIAMYDNINGTLKWDKSFNWRFISIASTPDGGYIAAGDSGTYNAIIAKFSSDDTLEWDKSFGGFSNDNFNSIASTPDGGYIAAGYSYSTNGDLTGLNKGGADAIIAKFSSDGTLEWNKNFGGSGYDVFASVAST